MKISGPWLIFVGLLGLLAGCPPSRIKSPPPRRTAPAACAPGQIRRCLGDCVTPQQQDQPCTPNECSPGALVCAAGLACVAGPSASPARCMPPLPPAEPGNTGAFQACDPSVAPNRVELGGANWTSNACVNNSVCLRTFPDTSRPGQCLRIDQGANGSTNPRQGACVGPAIDGEACDSDFTTAQTTRGVTTAGTTTRLTCRPCAPGLACHNNICRRPCFDPGNPGAVGLSACPRNSLLQQSGSTNEFQCSVIATRDPSPPNPADQFTVVPSTPNTICTSCAPRGAVCGRLDQYSAEGFSSVSVRLPVLPPAVTGLQTWPVSIVTSAAERGQRSGAASIIAPGTTGSTLTLAGPCCGSDVCFAGRCCVPPSMPCTSDQQCCSFALEQNSSGVVPISGLCMSVRSNDGRDILHSTVFNSFKDVQQSGCFAPICGALGQVCCPSILGSPSCQSGLACDSRSNTCQVPCDRCRRCDVAGQVATGQGFETPCSGPGNGFCRALSQSECGTPGQPCCQAGAGSDGCNNNLSSSAPSYCGVASGGNTCPFTSATTMCYACGLTNQQCCPTAGGASACAPGNICDTSAPGGARCIRGTNCGTVGGPCCDGDGIACAGNPTEVACISGTCTTCGGLMEPCCGPPDRVWSCRTTATGQKLACGSTATGRRCVSCGAIDQPCCLNENPVPGGPPVQSCDSGLTCRVNPTSGGSVCRP